MSPCAGAVAPTTKPRCAEFSADLFSRLDPDKPRSHLHTLQYENNIHINIINIMNIKIINISNINNIDNIHINKHKTPRVLPSYPGACKH